VGRHLQGEASDRKTCVSVLCSFVMICGRYSVVARGAGNRLVACRVIDLGRPGVGVSVLNRQSAVGVVRIRGFIDGKRGFPFSWCGYRMVLGFYDLVLRLVCLCRFFSLVNTYFGLYGLSVKMMVV